jgi:predicted enzyme related to lactoylglutathione lyase
MGNYVLATTTDSDENGRPKTPGTINGGFFPKAGNPAQYPLVVIWVEDIKEHIKKVEWQVGKCLVNLWRYQE